MKSVFLALSFFFCLLFPSFSLIFGPPGLLSPLNDDFYPMKSVIFEDFFVADAIKHGCYGV